MLEVIKIMDTDNDSTNTFYFYGTYVIVFIVPQIVFSLTDRLTDTSAVYCKKVGIEKKTIATDRFENNCVSLAAYVFRVKCFNHIDLKL